MSREEHVAFVAWQWETFPEKDEFLYHHSSDLPAVVPLLVHLIALGYDDECSLNPLPGPKISTLLIEQYLQHGFMTSGEPLLVVQSQNIDNCPDAPWASESFGPGKKALAANSLGYLKGFARVSSLMMMLHVTWKLELDSCSLAIFA